MSVLKLTNKLDVTKGIDGGLRYSMECPVCGSRMWVKEPDRRFLRGIWGGVCPNCNHRQFSYVKKRLVPLPMELCKDRAKIVEYLRYRAIRDVDPMLLAAADMISSEGEKEE